MIVLKIVAARTSEPHWMITYERKAVETFKTVKFTQMIGTNTNQTC